MALEMKYFILKPTSSDPDFARASRVAMLSFAVAIEAKDPQLATDLREWALSTNKAAESRGIGPYQYGSKPYD